MSPNRSRCPAREFSKKAVMSVGMHRSGTSAVTGVLNFLGCALPKNMSGLAHDNERDFWECPAIRDLNDEILEAAGTSWDGWEPFDTSWYESLDAEEFRRSARTLLEEEFGDASPFVLKDPRICRLLPFWVDAVRCFGAEPVIVSPIRNPFDIAASLEARDRIDPSIGLLIWLRNILDAEFASRDLTRVFVRYERLLAAPREVVKQLNGSLGIEGLKQSVEVNLLLDEFLSADLCHHRSEDASLLENPEVSFWLRSTFEIFHRWTVDDLRPEDGFALDRIRESFNDAVPAFSRAVRLGLQGIQELRETTEELDERTRELHEKTRELHAIREKLYERELKITSLSTELAATREFLSVRDSDLARMDAQLCEMRASTSWRLTIPLRYVGAILKRGVRLARFIRLALRTPRCGIPIFQRLLVALRQGGLKEVWRKFRLLLEAGEGSFQRVISPEERWREFVPPNPESNSDVFVLAIINWDFRFQRPQHLAAELANSGRRVFYVEMLLEPNGLKIGKLGTNLYRVGLPARDIGYIQPYVGQATSKQKKAWFEAFLLLCDSVSSTSFKQIIIQHPFWWQMTKPIPPEFQLIYDCMDDISGFENTTHFVLDLEKDLVEHCDALIVSSQALFDKYMSVRTPRLIRNGANIGHFLSKDRNRFTSLAQTLPSLDMRHFESESSEAKFINVGYVGAIANWFDAELVRSVAASEPDFRFHLCGEVTSKTVGRVFRHVENVSLYGEIPYVDVPAFLDRMDVLIIPFRMLPIIESCDPVKFYEYSAAGKPTVATCLPELARASDLVFFASTPDEFASQIREACNRGQDPEFGDSLRDYASQNTWKQRCDDLVDVLQDLPLVSVVILSYGDPELTMAAIDSLFNCGPTYPRMEVLVVDNGSTPANLSKISSRASEYPDVRIIENGSNLGFAKGNNIGLEQAGGEFVLLLNNDTFVAPGAVYAMVRHLRDNPGVGAVGPLTNNIGNEAKVFVRYDDMDQMKRMVRRMTLGFRGRFLKVDALGYFAVMFRRKDLELFGLLPLDYGLGMFEDDDHCRAIQSRGYITVVAEDGFVHHHQSASFDIMKKSEKRTLFKRNRAIFEKKWGPWKAHQYRNSRPEKVL